jgi:hypothetical protein
MIKNYYNIKFRIKLGFIKIYKNLLDQQQGVAILNCNSIKGLIVYAEAESSTRFFGK